MGELKKTSLHELHLKLGAKMVEFGGWDMPVQYTGIIEEHKAVREAAGLFDVSHMGEIKVSGAQALPYLQKMLTNNIARLVPGQALYTLMCYPTGGVVDDLLVYRLGEEDYWLVVNASNKEKDLAWLLEHQRSGVNIADISGETGQIALQGPEAQTILQKLTEIDLNELKFFHFVWAQVAGSETLISRTGYTGEDGFELYLAADKTPDLWLALLENGQEQGLVPVGLGARDTLRFEAKLPLYGHELSEKYTPIEAGLGYFVALDKESDFIGKAVLEKQKKEGVERKLVGLEMLERGIPRAGYILEKEGIPIGEVTSGSYSPTLMKSLALGYVRTADAVIGNKIQINIRGKGLQAQIIKTPFYKREVK